MKGFRARLLIEGLHIMRLLEVARDRGLPLYGLARRGTDALCCECREDDLPDLRTLAEERGYRVTMLPPKGLKRAQVALIARPGLVLGAVAFALALSVCMRFVWRVEIAGAGKYAGEARLFLAERGVRVGVAMRGLDAAALQAALEWRLPGVSYVQVTASGAVVRVLMYAGTEADAPETTGAPGDVVASRDGVLDSLSAFAGTPVKRVGDPVRAGEVLIRGEERGAGGEPVAVKARGEAIARVWVSQRVRLPAYETLTTYTGRATQRFLFVTPWLTVASAPEPEYLAFDRELSMTPLPGAWLPLQVVRETRREAALEYAARDLDACVAEATEAATRLLLQKTAGYHMVDKWADYSMIGGGIVEANATGEFLLDIARYVPHTAT